ncbi:MAG TPA: FtsX-like permease family protein [Bacteroidales bacterium]|nr:FtsX-like permease family protein [Bacteroidales bacterium]
MIATDFKIALRNILHNKVQSAISILGLGIGLGSIILLMTLIIHETSFDKFIPGYSNVARILFGQTYTTPFPLAEEMKKDFPEVKDYFRFYQAFNVGVGKVKNEMAWERRFSFSDTSVYRIMGVKLIAGLPANSVNEVTISEKTALRVFGKTSPIGDVLFVKLNPTDLLSLTVTGIYKEFPSNSTLFPEFIANIKLSEKMFVNFKAQLGQFGDGITNTALNWNLPVLYSYVVLDKNTDKQVLASKMGKYNDLLSDQNLKEWKYSLQPVNEIYLNSAGLTGGGNPAVKIGNSNELKYYWSISFLILLISVINYIFLTRASTSDRFRELGTRKVLGALPKNLRRQIMLESNLITILSLIPASFVIDSGMSLINSTLNKTLSNEVFSNPLVWIMLFSIVIFTGTISGLLIGYKISKTPSLLLLSGKTTEKALSKRWNYSFLVFHFSIYIILVVSVLSVTKQIRYSLTNTKGINPKNILVSYLNSPKLQAGFSTICNEMERVPGVLKVSGGSFIPPLNYTLPVTLQNNEGEKIRFDGLIMGEGMTEMLNIEVIEGSSFGPYQTARIEVLFNESSAKEYNIKVGDNYLNSFYVKGIVKDFHSHSLHNLIQPMVILQQNPEKMGLVAIKTDGTNDKIVKDKLREIFSQIDPDEILDVDSITDNMKEFYSAERNQAKITGAFSILATVLAIMGLFGIALISILRKTKEIGLRKVNGASITEIMFLLNKNFVKWVLVSLFIGIPASYYLMLQWQNRFAYKTELSWWIFAVAGFSAILIAVITISLQSWKTATRNPVEALRYE